MTFIVDGTNGGFFPSWTTATRPASPSNGQMGYNTTTGLFDAYNGSAWVSVATSATAPVNGPTFSAYQSSAQTLSSSTNTLINLQTESWDTASAFNNTGSTVGGVPAYAFLPTVAGYYQVNGGIRAGASTTEIIAFVYKNGSNAAYGNDITANGLQSTVSTIVYLNGSTDYIQFYGFVGSGQVLNASAPTVYFNAAMVRPA